MKTWRLFNTARLLLLAAAVVCGAYHKNARWLRSSARQKTPVETSTPGLTDPIVPPAPAAKLVIAPPVEVLTPVPDQPLEFSTLVAESQHVAVARYPELGRAGSEMNSRFCFRYKQWLKANSARLQDPSWPILLADECAKASRGRVRPTPAATHATTASTGLLTNGTPPAAQTLAFYPSTLPTTVAPGPATVAKPSGNPFVTMEAVNQHSGNDYTYNWISGWGSYDVSFRQSVGLHVDVRNMSRGPAELNLRWAFFARKQSNNGRFVFAAETKPLDLKAGENLLLPIDSPLVESRDRTYVMLGERYLEGSKYEGWLVQVTDRKTGAIIKQNGSTDYLEDLGRNSDFKTLIADYTNRSRRGSINVAHR